MADVVTVWNPFIITNNGLNLRQEAIATGKTVAFNFAKIGQGVPSNPANIPLMTDVVTSAQQVPVVRSESNDVTHFVGVRIDNLGFTQPVLMREIGLFASIDGGEPILYGYTYATQGYDSIPAGSVSHYIWTVGIDTVLSRAQSISFTYDGSTVYASYDDIDQLIQAFDTFKAEVQELSSAVVFSDANIRPTGGWTLWLQDFGEIPNLPPEETPLVLETAPLNAPGNIAVVDDAGNGETVVNMTDNPQTAKDDDIILAED